jgi:hypothetical protein
MRVKTAIVTGMTVVVLVLFVACERRTGVGEGATETPTEAQALLSKYTTFRLTSDLDGLNDNQKKMIALLIDAGRAMDDAFWIQAYGDKQSLLESIDDPDLRRFAEINYGPWDRKPAGAKLYPPEMTNEEFDAAADESTERG